MPCCAHVTEISISEGKEKVIMHVINFTDSDLIPVVLHILQNDPTIAYQLNIKIYSDQSGQLS